MRGPNEFSKWKSEWWVLKFAMLGSYSHGTLATENLTGSYWIIWNTCSIEDQQKHYDD